jgi:soluble lytic murein transglycosylase-like protein
VKGALLLVCLLVAPGLPRAEIRMERRADGALVATNAGQGAYAPAAPRPPREVAGEGPGGLEAPESLDRLIRDVARETDLSPALIRAVVAVESGFDPLAVSHKGAQGLMQLMPATAEAYGVDDAHDPRGNLEAGARHLRDLLRQYRGDLGLALAAYNAGPEAVRRHGGIPPYQETRQYVARVMALYRSERTASRPAQRDPREVYSYRDARGNLVLSNVAARGESTPVRRAGMPR